MRPAVVALQPRNKPCHITHTVSLFACNITTFDPTTILFFSSFPIQRFYLIQKFASQPILLPPEISQENNTKQQ